MAQFAEHRKAFEEDAAETGPIIERPAEAFDEVTATGKPSRRPAVIYRPFVNEFPRMRPNLSTITGSAAAAGRRQDDLLPRERATAALIPRTLHREPWDPAISPSPAGPVDFTMKLFLATFSPWRSWAPRFSTNGRCTATQ